MEILGVVFLVVGGIISVLGGIGFLVVAFKESPLWGFGCLFIPFISIVFLITHWDRASKAFFYQLAGAALIAVGVLLGGKLG